MNTLLAQVVQVSEPNLFRDWIAPGSATAAIIIVVIIFLRQMRYIQTKSDKAIREMSEKVEKIASGFQEQVTGLTNTMMANEERRIGQIQQLFDKMMIVSTQSVQAISKLESGFTVLMQRVEARLEDKKQGK